MSRRNIAEDQTAEIVQEIMVVNPYNGKKINVMPFFELLNDWYNDSPKHAATNISNHFRFLSILNVLLPEDFSEVELDRTKMANLLQTLDKLFLTFSNMIEIEKIK